MLNKNLLIVLILFFGISLHSCGQKQESAFTNELIASKQGFDLTEAHFETYLKYVEKYAGETADLKTQIAIKSQLKATFLKEPETLLKQLELLNTDEEKPQVHLEKEQSQATTGVSRTSTPTMAEGHKIVRDLLGSDIGQMKFDTEAANTFRAYMANTLLTTSSNSSNSGYGSSDYSSSKGQIQFCANGSFVEVLSGHLSIGTEGMDASSSGSSAMPGYWEAAALPNGMFVIIMYSTHARMLEDSANGILPFVVAKHGHDFVQLPNGDLYRRAANQYCN